MRFPDTPATILIIMSYRLVSSSVSIHHPRGLSHPGSPRCATSATGAQGACGPVYPIRPYPVFGRRTGHTPLLQGPMRHIEASESQRQCRRGRWCQD